MRATSLTVGRGLAAVLCGTALLAAACGTASSGRQAAGQVSSPASPEAAGTSPSAVGGTAPAVPVPSGAVPGCTGTPGGDLVIAPGVPATVPALAAVQFVSARQGWVAGAGRVLATSDGGKTWVRQYTGPARLDQVDFTDAGHGWAVGTDVLLRTTDGGATWAATGDPCGSIRSVHFVTPDLGYAVAGGSQVRIDGGLPAPVTGGQLLATTDGGRDWRPVAGAPARVQTACFTSTADGFAGTPGRVWRTTDGGRRWSPAFTEPPPSSGVHPPAPDTTVVQCAGAGAAWVLFLGSGAALGHAPYLAYAGQDAHRWHALFEESYIETAARPTVHAPDGPGSYPGPFSAISPDAAAFVGYSPQEGYGAAPLDLVSGGATVARAGSVGGISQPYGTAFVSSALGWVVGKRLPAGYCAIEATSDGGRTWTSQYQTR